MDWSADVTIAGTLASVGARLIEGTANKMIGQTFDCIRSSSRPAERVSRGRARAIARNRRTASGVKAGTCVG